MQTLNILLYNLNHSGTSHAAVVLANNLAAKGIAVSLIIVGQDTQSPFNISSNVTIRFLGVKRPGSFFGKIPYVLKSTVAVGNYIQSSTPKNLIVFAKEFGCVCIFLRKIMSMNHKIIIINSTFITGQLHYTKSFLTRQLHTFFYKIFLPKADHIIAICNAMIDDMVQNYSVPRNKISVIYPTIDEKFFNTDYDNTINKEVIFIGRINKHKGPDKLIRNFAKISNKDATLRIVGDGPMLDEIKALAEQLNLQGKITFEGNQQNVLPYLQKASLLVMTSDFEGFGQVLAEAIACGKPVVSFNCPVGPSEIVQNEINGYLVETGNEEELTAKIDLALSRNWNRNEIAKTAEKFHPAKVISEYIKVIEQNFL
ncbi:MAG: glycosyl transferase [Rickettsiaceae bacterium]|jgi:glycosyltransferase involved in cell wall biosynthesis|nr:glycosyl transferase [Rickettsiaceae bacterium]